MAEQHYFFKLISPRPTFPHDITDEETRLMDDHGRYFQQHFEAGRLLLYGPVMATGGAFGVAILEVNSFDESAAFWRGRPIRNCRVEQA